MGAQDLKEILKYRHWSLFEERPDNLPGEIKTKNNQAGSTIFVHPDYVRGLFFGSTSHRDARSAENSRICGVFKVCQ